MNDAYYFINQDNESSLAYCIYLEEYPEIEFGQKEYKKTAIAGRGNVYIPTGAYSDTKIKFTADVNVLGTGHDRMEMYLAARAFLKRSTAISFCESKDYFYKIKTVDLGDVEQYCDIAGDFLVSLTCEAGIYLRKGLQEYAYTDKVLLYNPYSLCHPIYLITGEGACNIVVNSKTISANIGQNLTINTDLMLSYRKDGTLQNTSISGDYEDLYLRPGDNTISITDGFELKVIPNWRCL